MPISPYVREIREKIGHAVLLSIGAAAIIFNERGEILLQHRSDDGTWGVPGGAVEPGEEPADSVVREVWEETGLEVIPERILGVEGGPDMLHTYPNGDQVMVIGIVFACRVVGGELKINDEESLELRYFPPDQLPAPLMAHHVPRIAYAVKNLQTTYFRFKGQEMPLP